MGGLKNPAVEPLSAAVIANLPGRNAADPMLMLTPTSRLSALRIERSDTAQRAEAGIIHDYINHDAFLRKFIENLLRRLGLREVLRQHLGRDAVLALQFFRQRRQPVSATGHQHEIGFVGREQLGQLQTNAGGRPGNQRGFHDDGSPFGMAKQ
jgi:hypothetical protein